MSTPKRTILTQPDDAVSADPQPVAEQTPMLSDRVAHMDASLPDPAAIDAAEQQALADFFRSEPRAFLAPLAEGIDAQVALYRAKGTSPRARHLIDTFARLNRARYYSNGSSMTLFEEAERRIKAIKSWPGAADRAAQAAAKIPTLTGAECERTTAMRLKS